MARIRTIKPEFPQSESMGRVSREARLLFILLWPICDDHGRTRAASRLLASLLFPYDDDAPSLIEGWLVELECEGCIRRYDHAGSTYLEVCNWLIHQKIDKPSRPIFPGFDESSRALASPRESSPLDLRTKGSKDQGPKDLDIHPSDVVADGDQKKARLAEVTSDAVESYNAAMSRKGAGKLAAVTIPDSDQRRKQVKRAIKLAARVCGDLYGETRIVRTFWDDYFAECRKDPFLSGDGPYSGAHANWRPDFEYLTRPDVIERVLDKALSHV